VLEVEDLHVSFPGRGVFARPVEVLHGVSVEIAEGETLGLVGESGSGKTTLGRTVIGLVTPTSGEIRFDGARLEARTRANRKKHATEIQVVFQDPYSSLNPAMTIGDTLSEPLVAQGVHRTEAVGRIRELLDLVNLPSNSLNRLPREFSGGQRQRVAIARALALNPRLIVCDEPVSALDLANQARVLELLIDIQERTGVAYLFISHDLMVIRRMSHRVAVMYRGEIVETGPADEVTSNPRHPYSQRLLLSSPVLDPQEQRERREQRRLLEKAVPTLES
jgi:ABC-type glutathione transport system ATPase component